MKTLTLFFVAALAVWAQNPPASGLQPVSSPVPGGACTNSQPAFYSSADQKLYTCLAGVWTAVSGGGGGSGTVTSVGLSLPASIFAVSGSPVTTAGTLTGAYATGQTANIVFGTDGSGNVGLMNLTTAQLPSAIPNSKLANSATTVNGQTCTLGASCTVTAAPSTTIVPGASTGNVLTTSGTANSATDSGTAANSLVTLAGTQTLTNKSISSGQITGLAASATTDTTNASNITSGTLPAAQLPSTVVQTNQANTYTADQTFSGQVINSSSGAAAKSPFSTSGSWYTAGTSSTNHGNVINAICSGATAPTYNTAGEGIVVDACTGYAGNFINLLLNGSSKWKVDYQGTITLSGNIVGTNSAVEAYQFADGSNNKGYWVTNVSGINWQNINRVTTNVNVQIKAVASQTADLMQYANSSGTIQAGINAGGFQYLDPIATASLPTCSTSSHAWRGSVNDATAPVIGSALTGGGSVFATVHCSLTTGTYLVDGL